MKPHPALLSVITGLTLVFFLFTPAASMDDPGFSIKRMVMCERIVDKEPLNVSATFSADTEKVYSFLEATDIAQDTTVRFVWYFEGREMARVSLPLKQGRRWRTYSSKKLAGLKGDWEVELLEPSGIVLNTILFTVR